jgi:shikimate kinase
MLQTLQDWTGPGPDGYNARGGRCLADSVSAPSSLINFALALRRSKSGGTEIRESRSKMAEDLAPLASRLMGRIERTVVLVGLMGAGKSCVGRRLASRLGLSFVDADAEFEAAAGCTISDYFARYGEAAFREGERKVIARLLDAEPVILATGGGAFVDPDTRDRIKQTGISVWIRADLDLLLKRTVGRDHRPLLKQGDPREILGRLMDIRYPLYAEADITVDSSDEAPEATVARVMAGLIDYLESPQ